MLRLVRLAGRRVVLANWQRSVYRTPQRGHARVGDLAGDVDGWGEYGTAEHGAGVRYELALAAGWLAAYVLAPALGDNGPRIDAHLDALARHIVDGPTH